MSTSSAAESSRSSRPTERYIDPYAQNVVSFFGVKNMKGNQRGKLLLLQRFLEENTDAEHPTSMEQILSWLEEQDIQAERKKMY